MTSCDTCKRKWQPPADYIGSCPICLGTRHAGEVSTLEADLEKRRAQVEKHQEMLKAESQRVVAVIHDSLAHTLGADGEDVATLTLVRRVGAILKERDAARAEAAEQRQRIVTAARLIVAEIGASRPESFEELLRGLIVVLNNYRDDAERHKAEYTKLKDDFDQWKSESNRVHDALEALMVGDDKQLSTIEMVEQLESGRRKLLAEYIDLVRGEPSTDRGYVDDGCPIDSETIRRWHSEPDTWSAIAWCIDQIRVIKARERLVGSDG